MKPRPRYWFPAKRYGWGWGPPVSWQGWVVLVVFLALVAGAAFVFPPNESVTLFLTCIGVLCLLLVAVCWLKGEPPRWRWGDDDRA